MPTNNQLPRVPKTLVLPSISAWQPPTMTPTGYKHPFLPPLLGICIAKPQSFPILILQLFQFISFATVLASFPMAHDNKHQPPGLFPQPSAPYPPPAMYPPPAPAAYPPPTEVYPSPSPPPPPPPQAYYYPPPPQQQQQQAYSYPPPPAQGYPVTASPYVAPPPASYPMKNGPGYPQPNPPPPRRSKHGLCGPCGCCKICCGLCCGCCLLDMCF